MKRILLLTVIILAFSSTKAQGLDPADSARIASLQKQLKNAKGIKEIDILNDIGWEYTWGAKDKTPVLNYATQAKKKAEALRYEKGVGFATLMLSWYYGTTNKPLSDSLSKRAFAIAEKIKDLRLLGWYYWGHWELKKAFTYFKQAKDIEGEAEAAAWLCSAYSTNADNEADFSYCQRALELAPVRKTSRLSYNKWLASFTYNTMVDMYNYVGDFQSAFSMLKQSEKYSSQRDLYWYYASTYKQMGKHDSSLYYFEKAFEGAQNKWGLIRHVANANLKAGNYNRAIQLLEEASDIFQKGEAAKRGSPFHWRGDVHARLAEAYDSLGKRQEAVKNYEFALEHSRILYHKIKVPRKPDDPQYQYEGDRKNQVMIVSGDLSKIFAGLRQYDSAYYYLARFTDLKDTVDSKKRIRQLNMQLSNFKKAAEDQKRTSQLQLLQKDNQLNQARLKQEATLRNGLAVVLLLLLLISVFTVRALHFKRKSERLRALQLENELKVKELESKQKQTELQQKATDLEMQALRAQMNPHFIFNCLSSINRFVLKNETEAASDYLTRFSRLIRMVLINSQKSTITLEDELEMLKLYLDMERLRFKHSFDYNIIYSNTVDAGNIFIPPLLLQPFCENAIWHGLMHKEGQGKLDINIQMQKNVLHCTISDNGIGRKKAEELKSKSAEKSKSLGLKITTDRLALLNENKNVETFYQLHDLVDEKDEPAGTKIEIRIKYKDQITELIS